MLRRFLSALFLIVLAIPVVIVLSFLLGWGPGSSAGGTLKTGRTVIAHSDSIYLTTMFDTDTATIKTAFKTIVIQPTGVVVNGANIASIDPKVSKVEVHVDSGAIRVVADGQTVTPSVP